MIRARCAARSTPCCSDRVLLALAAPRRPGARRRRGPLGRDERQGRHQRRLHHHRRVPALIAILSLIQWPWTSARTSARRPRRRAAPAPTCAAAGSPTTAVWSTTSAPAPPRSSPSTGPSAATRSTARPPTALHEAFRAFAADDGARVLVAHGRGRGGVLRRRRPQGARHAGPAARPARGPARLHPPELAQADDRRGLGLVPGRRLRARAVVRPARRDPERALRLHRAPLRRAADRRRDAAAAADRRQRPRARPRDLAAA